MLPRIWFITYEGLPGLDPDDALPFKILRDRGYDCEVKVWDDPLTDWNQCQFALVRNTWDYHLKYHQFLDWLQQPVFDLCMWNPPKLIQWNSCKTYLRDLEQQGIDIVPTVWLEQGMSSDQIETAIDDFGARHAVLKPTIGLATAGVSKLDLQNKKDAYGKAEALLKKQSAMLQPYMAEVETIGEHSLIFLNGEFSHAIRKMPFQSFAPAGGAGERITEPEVDEIKLAQNVLSKVPHDWLYARVDVVRDSAHNKPRLMELEMVEPSLFLQFDPRAPKRFADAIIAKTGAEVFNKGLTSA